MAHTITLHDGPLDGERRVIDDITPELILDTDDGQQQHVRTGGSHSVGTGRWVYSYQHAPKV